MRKLGFFDFCFQGVARLIEKLMQGIIFGFIVRGSLSAVFIEAILTGFFSNLSLDNVNKQQQIMVNATAITKNGNPSCHLQFLLKPINHKVKDIGAREVATKKNFAILLSILYYLQSFIKLLLPYY